MFINKTLTIITIVGLLFGNLVAQPNSAAKPKYLEISPELQKNAVEFLRQTIKEIPNLKSEENRLYFKLEMARLLWKYDAKESRLMLEEATREVKQLMIRLADDYRKAVEEIKKERTNSNSNYAVNRAMVNNAYRSNSYVNATNSRSNSGYSNATNRAVAPSEMISIYDTGQVMKFFYLSNLRRRLIQNLAEAEPLLAYQFLTETNQIFPEEMKDYPYNDNDYSLERMTTAKLLEKNEVDKSVELAREILSKNSAESFLSMNFTENFLSILTMIYEKDAIKGNSLAEEVLSRLITPVDKANSRLPRQILIMFFDEFTAHNTKNPAILSEKSFRDLAKLLGKMVLAEMSKETYYFQFYEYAKKIEKYAPREALQILQKAKQRRYNNVNRPLVNIPYDNRPYPISAAANKVAMRAINARVANMAAINVPAKSKSSKPKTVPTPPESQFEISPTPDEWTLTNDSKEELVQKLKTGKFTTDERKKIVESAKQYALETNQWNYGRPDRFVSVVTELAMFSLISANKDVTDDLMKEAEVYVRPEAKNSTDYISKVMLAVGYSIHRPEKSFALMESLTSINEVLAGALKYAEFTDLELTDNGEVTAAMFLGESRFMQEFSKRGEFPVLIQNLAKADFKRTTELAGKFERTEVKMAAKILILESLLGELRESYRGEEIDL